MSFKEWTYWHCHTPRILRLKDHPALCQEYGRRARDFEVRNYDRKRLAEGLEAILKEVTAQPPRVDVTHRA